MTDANHDTRITRLEQALTRIAENQSAYAESLKQVAENQLKHEAIQQKLFDKLDNLGGSVTDIGAKAGRPSWATIFAAVGIALGGVPVTLTLIGMAASVCVMFVNGKQEVAKAETAALLVKVEHFERLETRFEEDRLTTARALATMEERARWMEMSCHQVATVTAKAP